ncbi:MULTISPECIES: thiamine-binding protein [unclassified Saccharicrinis]|uniref:thiamine-binding protein n=1 Tax=unclassified Saccharicrinis TaxID=2646859 RepID=UPI003D355A40
MSVLVNFAMFPTDAGISISKPVSGIIELIKNSGVPYVLGPMGTSIETETMPEALEIINKAYALLEKDHDRVYANITMDVRRGDVGRMKSKIQSIENKIGKVNT